MIISRTPLRISFVGGGTDIPAYYRQALGAVVSTAIDKYVYVMVNEKFDGKVRAGYSITENVDTADDLKHELIRESMHLLGISGGVEVVSVSDIPGGSGLGSSSSYAVGVLNALHAYKGERVGPEQLAREACRVEIEMCGKPIGKQDQYIAAYGGLRYFEFRPDNNVYTERLYRPALQSRLMLFHTGVTRRASDILTEQVANTPSRMAILRQMARLALFIRGELRTNISLISFGAAMRANWRLKKLLASGITDSAIDMWYARARRAGAIAGKITGAGGGGFLLVYAMPKRHAAIEAALNLRRVLFHFEDEGSEIIYAG